MLLGEVQHPKPFIYRISETLNPAGSAMRTDQDIAQVERIAMAYRRLANAMILSTLREISKMDEVVATPDDTPEMAFVESSRIDPWCELAGLEPEIVRKAAKRLIEERPF